MPKGIKLDIETGEVVDEATPPPKPTDPQAVTGEKDCEACLISAMWKGRKTCFYWPYFRFGERDANGQPRGSMICSEVPACPMTNYERKVLEQER